MDNSIFESGDRVTADEFYHYDSLPDHAVFNSIADHPEYGNERQFLKISEVGKPDIENPKLEMHKQYEVTIYYHNDADKEYNKKIYGKKGIAYYTKVSAGFPKAVMGGYAKIRAAITFGETMPVTVSCEAEAAVSEPMALCLAPHSARIYTFETAWNVNGLELPEEELFSEEGTFLGVTKLDGTIRGGEKYAGKVVFVIETCSISEKFQNILRADRMEKGMKKKKYLLGTTILCKDIAAITFLNSKNGMRKEYWDVSMAQDESVIAWVQSDGSGCEVYIAGDGGVTANPVCVDLFRDCCNLKKIRFDHNFDMSLVTDMKNLFYGCCRLEELDLSGLETSQATDMGRMFCHCSSLKKLAVSTLDTSKVRNMRWMFGGCISLKELDISGFDTSQVTDMSAMFIRCISLAKLKLGSFAVSNVKDMSYMFRGCMALEQSDICNIDSSGAENVSYMF